MYKPTKKKGRQDNFVFARRILFSLCILFVRHWSMYSFDSNIK